MKKLPKAILIIAAVLGVSYIISTFDDGKRLPDDIKRDLDRIEGQISKGEYESAISSIDYNRKIYSSDSVFMHLLDSFELRIDTLKSISEETKAEELAEAEENYKNALNRLKNLRSNHDEFKGVTWYRHKTSPRYDNRNGLYLYFGRDGETDQLTNLRFKVQYVGDDWLFIRKCIFLIDGEPVDYVPGSFDRDNDGGEIWEINDSPADVNTLAMLYLIAASKESKIRFVGDKYHKDKTITSSQKQALKEILEIYGGLANKPS